jgi:hypothetical protein
MWPDRLNKLRPFASLGYHNDRCLTVDHEATHTHAFLRQMSLDISVLLPLDGASKRRRLAYERLLYGRGYVQRVSEVMTLHLSRVLVVAMLGVHIDR